MHMRPATLGAAADLEMRGVADIDIPILIIGIVE